MSLSKPKISSPCKKFIEFKGNIGVFQTWDKEKKENVKLPYPIRFIVLDELNTIKGFNDSTQSGIYSNEVHNLSKEELTIRTFKGNLSVVGLYADIKSNFVDMGGKFCKSVYAALINKDDSLELVNFQLSGAAFKAWADKQVNTQREIVVVSDCTDGKKGNVKYKIPNYRPEELPRELLDKAMDMDKMLQEYLDSKKTEVKEPSYNEDAKQAPSATHRGEPASFDEVDPNGEIPF